MYTQLQQAKRKYSGKDFIRFNNQALDAAAEFKKCEVKLIEALQQVFTSRTFQYFGFSSLFDYAVKNLNLTESQAYAYTAVAKKALQCDELNEAIQSEELSVSKAYRIVSVVDTDNQAEWVDKAVKLTKRELEKQVAMKNPKVRVWDHFRHLDKDLIHMQAGIDEACFLKIKRVQELLAKKRRYQGRGVKVRDVLEGCLDEFLERHDPVVKAQRILKKKEEEARKREEMSQGEEANKGEEIKPGEKHSKQDQKNSARAENIKASNSRGSSSRAEALATTIHHQTPNQRKKLPAHTQHQIFFRDRGQCQFRLPSGEKCGDSRYIDFHHIVPISKGGSDDISNLMTVCKNHHQVLHMSF